MANSNPIDVSECAMMASALDAACEELARTSAQMLTMCLCAKYQTPDGVMPEEIRRSLRQAMDELGLAVAELRQSSALCRSVSMQANAPGNAPGRGPRPERPGQ